MRGGELLADQRQQRRVGEMKQHHAEAENHQRPRGEQDAEPGGAFRFPPASMSPRPVIVNRGRRDRQDGNARQQGEDRDQQEHGALGKQRADRRRRQRDGDIAGMVEGRVAPHAPRKLLMRIKSQRQRGHGGAEDIADHRHRLLAIITGHRVGRA